MSRSYKIAGLVGILLALMVATQYLTGTTPEEINNKPKSAASNAANKDDGHGSGPVKLPPSIGPKDARVKIKVYVTSDNTCDTTTINGMKQVAQKFGKKVRVDYVDLLNKDVMSEAQTAKISCKSGITLNGKSVLHLPDKSMGVRGLVMFDGPMGPEKNYGVPEIEAAVDYLLKIQNKTAKDKQTS